MKIFKVSLWPTSPNANDCGFIVAAIDEADARTIPPDYGREKYYRKNGAWHYQSMGIECQAHLKDWPNTDEELSKIHVVEIGTALPSIQRGVILSFDY